MEKICSDLESQYKEFDDLVAPLGAKAWRTVTPFFQWTIFDQVAHIAFFDHEALLAIEDEDRFRKRAKGVIEVVNGSGSWPAYINPLLGPEEPEELLSVWRDIRIRLLRRLGSMAPRDRLPWYGLRMSARSFATARLMETWAHAQDVFDTLKVKRINSNRIRHIAHLGVKTFEWSFKVRGLDIPPSSPQVTLTGHAGDIWEWGKADESERVWGKAEEFCLVVTQRRNVADTHLKWQGDHAEKWLNIAQAFAGLAQAHPSPGERIVTYAT